MKRKNGESTACRNGGGSGGMFSQRQWKFRFFLAEYRFDFMRDGALFWLSKSFSEVENCSAKRTEG